MLRHGFRWRSGYLEPWRSILAFLAFISIKPGQPSLPLRGPSQNRVGVVFMCNRRLRPEENLTESPLEPLCPLGPWIWSGLPCKGHRAAPLVIFWLYQFGFVWGFKDQHHTLSPLSPGRPRSPCTQVRTSHVVPEHCLSRHTSPLYCGSYQEAHNEEHQTDK